MISGKEPLMDEDRIALAEVRTLVGTIREDIHEMRDELRRSNQDKVGRAEWAQQNLTTENQIIAVKAEVSEIKTGIASHRIPVTAGLAIVISILTFGWMVLGPAVISATSSDAPVTVEERQP